MGESLEEGFQNDILQFTLPEPVQVASRLFGHPGEDTRLERVLGVLKNLQPVQEGDFYLRARYVLLVQQRLLPHLCDSFPI